MRKQKKSSNEKTKTNLNKIPKQNRNKSSRVQSKGPKDAHSLTSLQSLSRVQLFMTP